MSFDRFNRTETRKVDPLNIAWGNIKKIFAVEFIGRGNDMRFLSKLTNQIVKIIEIDKVFVHTVVFDCKLSFFYSQLK